MAMYQAIYPESAVGNNAIVQPLRAQMGTFSRPQAETEDINTPLTPFTHADGSSFISRDISSARSIYTLGYAYPEVPPEYRTRSDEELSTFTRQAASALYRPDDIEETVTTSMEAPSIISTNSTFSAAKVNLRTRMEWLVTITFDGAEIDDSFTVWVYVGDAPTGYSGDQFLNSLNIVGGCSVFGMSTSMGSAIISGTVPLTKALTKKEVGLNPKRVIGYLKDNLYWRILKGSEIIDFAKLPSLKVQVNAAEVRYDEDERKLPVYGEWKTYYEPTALKKGGSSLYRKIPLVSKDVVAVNSTAI